jgi:hypothetical protein
VRVNTALLEFVGEASLVVEAGLQPASVCRRSGPLSTVHRVDHFVLPLSGAKRELRIRRDTGSAYQNHA